jgi:hypothetical protein
MILKSNSGKKKGQLSGFIIMGIVLLIMASLWLYSQSEAMQLPDTQEVPLQTKAIENYVQDCVKEVATPGLYLIAFQGGRYYTNDEYTRQGFENNNLLTFERALPYYINNGEKITLSKEQIEEQIASYITDNLPLCTDFSVFVQQGMIITEELPTAKVTIANDRVLFAITYPLDISIEKNTYSIGQFNYEVPLRLQELHTVAEKITDIIYADPSTAHFPEFLELNNKHKVMISVIPFDDEATAYSIFDDDEAFWIDDKPLIFWFAVQNSADKTNNKFNTAPSIINNKDFVLRKDIQFIYDLEAVDAEGDAVVFKTDDGSIPISRDGLYNFTPKQTGTFNIEITATDSRGLVTQEKVRFVIED